MLRIDYLPKDQRILEIICRWLHQEFSHYNPGETLEKRREWFEPRMGSTTIPLSVVAFLNDQPVGTASLVANDLESRPQLLPWLASVFVPPEFRRQGIASALCHRIADEARRLGHRQIYLFTPDQEALYARLGWTRCETTDYMDETIVIMRRTLIPPAPNS